MEREALRVFLSHTSELREHPPDGSFVFSAEQAVIRAGEAVLDMAYFTAREDQPAAYCRQQVQRASVYVGILGLRYGSPVIDEPELSYTELEFQTATEQGLPRLIFMLDEDVSLPIPAARLLDSDAELQSRQRAFRERVRKAGITVQLVGSPNQLELLLFQALKDLPRQTEQRIDSGLQRERQPAGKPAIRQARFVNPPPMTAPSWFQDRYVETKIIGDFLRDDGLRLLTVVGRGGVGKTAMVCRLLKALEAGRLPDNGGELAVDAIVYLSQVGVHPITFPNMFADLTRLLSNEEARQLQQLYLDPQQTPGQLMLTLLEAFSSGRSIVLLDNLEDLIDPATLAVSAAGMDAALRELLTAPQHGIKVIATTRLVPRELLLRYPGRSKRLDLDEGLPQSEAIKVLKSMDDDGALGLRDASPDLLAVACERTRGFPRALEALAAILAADRDTSLSSLLSAAQDVVPDGIVEVLVGEAFERLDPLGQQVMQALAIYAVPVPPVAVDYLLQPFQPAIHSGPVLSRLVNMHFARGDLGRYYLHQVDRDYAVNHVPQGQREDRDAGSATFTRYALRARAADYFKRIRTPQETWRSLDDLAPHLAEFELRWTNADYDTAAALLNDIDVDYLQKWGHYRLAVNMHERLLGRLTDPRLQMATAGALGSSYMVLGQTERAIEHYQQALAIAREAGIRRNEGALLDKLGGIYRLTGQTERAIEHSRQALAIARETGDRDAEGLCLGSLGNSYLILGQMKRAIRHYQKALAIARETGNLGYQGGWTGSLGSIYLLLGQTEKAVEHYQQALAITRETGNRTSEAFWLGNLGECYANLGQTEKAVEHYQQALAITRETGNRAGEAFWLAGLGNVYRDLGQTEQAFDYYQQAIEIGDDTGHAQVQAEARLGLAQVHLSRGEWPEARKVAESVPGQGYRPLLPQVFVALGTAYLRDGHSANAEKAFSAALSAANDLLASTDGLIEVLYAKGMASAGQAVAGKPDMTQAACRTFEQALAAAPAAGFRARVLRQLDLLVPADAGGVLTGIRRVLSEEQRDTA